SYFFHIKSIPFYFNLNIYLYFVFIRDCCAVKYCNSNLKEVEYFCFPIKNIERINAWKEFCKLDLPADANLRKFKICHHHFSPSDYIRQNILHGGKLELKSNTFPTMRP